MPPQLMKKSSSVSAFGAGQAFASALAEWDAAGIQKVLVKENVPVENAVARAANATPAERSAAAQIARGLIVM